MIRIRATRSPFQFMFMIASVLGGAALLIVRQSLGSSLAQRLPPLITVILGAGLLLAGALTLVGMAMQRVYGLLLERAGLVSMAILLFAYTGFVIAYFGGRGLITEIFFMSIVGACAWRIRQIGGDVGSAESAIRDASTERERGTP